MNGQFLPRLKSRDSLPWFLKPIKLKELLRTAKDPATQKIAIAENYTLYVVPLFEGLVKDVDKTLGERILSDWRVETDSTRFIALLV